METRINQVKEKALKVIEKKLDGDINVIDLKLCCECLNIISEDKNLMSKLFNDAMTNNRGFDTFNGNDEKYTI